MAVTIKSQPQTSQLLSAYKPIVITCEATTNDGNIPTLVFCDVYVNSIYYRTFFSSKADKNNQYVFDIQDAVQEKFSYFTPPMDGGQIHVNNASLVDVFVKIRTSKLNSSGLNEPEQIAPIPGTDDTLPIGGQGTTSNKFYSLNALVQHEENQDVIPLLSSFKTNEWNNEALPLTRRNETNYLTASQSSYFPFLSEKDVAKVKLFAKYKGQNDFSVYTKDINWFEDVFEVTNPPTITIKWLFTDNSENTNPNFWDLKYGAFPTIKIKTYPEDPDGDVETVELFHNVNNGGWVSLGFLASNTYDVTDLPVGNYKYKAKVTDSKNNSAESNVLSYEVKDTTPAPGTISLIEGDTIVVTGGTYFSRTMGGGGVIVDPSDNPDPNNGFTYLTNYNISFLDAIKIFYENKGMIASELRIKFQNLFGYNNWRYNNSLVTNSNYSNTEVTPQQISSFAAQSGMQEMGTAYVIHEFQIYHTADPSQVFTNYLQMEFD